MNPTPGFFVTIGTVYARAIAHFVTPTQSRAEVNIRNNPSHVNHPIDRIFADLER